MIWKERLQNFVTKIFKGLIVGYRLCLSPYFGRQCRFWPSCSDYALQALSSKPPHRALYLILRRLARCHPFHPGGIDLAPEGVKK